MCLYDDWTLPLLKCVVLAEWERREFARTRTTEPRTVSDTLVLMWPFDTITELHLQIKLGHVHLHRLLHVLRVWWRTDHPSSTNRKPVNTLQITSISKETHVRTIASIISERCDGAYDDSDFTASEMCCGCGGSAPLCANTNHDLVDAAGNTCSSYLTPDDCDRQLDTSSFTAQELCCACHGGGFQWLRRTLPTPPAFECVDMTPDQDTSCAQHAQNSSTCGMYVFYHSPLFSFSYTK